MHPAVGRARSRLSVRSDGVGHDRQRGTITVDLRMRCSPAGLEDDRGRPLARADRRS